MSHKLQSEQISALIDAELPDHEIDALLQQLADPENQADWAIYQQIGDVLRSDDLACEFSADFTQRFAARLAAEPAIIAAPRPSKSSPTPQRYWWAGGGFAVAAMLSWLFLPMLSEPTPSTQLAQHSSATQLNRVSQAGVLVQRATNSRASEAKADTDSERNPEELQLLRDPKLDSYLMAHQRYSPSLNQPGAYVARANVTNAASAK